MSSDYAHTQTDRELARLEQRIAKMYREAGEELQKTIGEYFAAFTERDKHQLELLKAGKITENQYKQWRLAQMGRGERFIALRNTLAERVTKANETAIAYVNDATPGIYSLNRNYTAYTIEQVSGNVGFTLFDEQTVKRLAVEEPDLMPYYPKKAAVKRGIDLAYGKRQITASITSGILQGKSIGKIANDLQSRMTTMSRASALRAARTAMTNAQNAGRQDGYIAAEKMGIKLRRKWMATLDSRTRHDHAILDGREAEVDEPFKVGGHEIMFPGDKSAPGYLVYNCRCTLAAVVDGVNTSNALRRDRDGLLPDMTFAQWEASKRGYSAKPVSRIHKEGGKSEKALTTNGGNSILNSSTKMDDIYIGRSAGAKAKNYEVMDLGTGVFFKFVEGTRLQNVEVFAGKGTKTTFRRAQKYAEKFGGKPEDWQHVKGFGVLDTDDGQRKAEVHWVQCEKYGKHDFFVKRWLDED